jgi:succinate dehydrogenase/fumarate reductase flavoprotein subunit
MSSHHVEGHHSIRTEHIVQTKGIFCATNNEKNYSHNAHHLGSLIILATTYENIAVLNSDK